MRNGVIAAAVLAMASLAGAQQSQLPEPPGRLVDVGGRRLHLLCAGTGAHAAVAQLSTNSYHCVVAGAGHEIHLFKPEAVVKAVTDVLEAVRRRQPLRRREC